MASPIDPTSLSLYQEALDLFKEKRLTEAIQKAELLLQKDPAFEDAYEALAIFYSKAGRLDDAIETAKKWVRLNPNSKMAHVNLSRFYVEKGMIAEAEREQGEARRLGWIEELTQKKMRMPRVDPEEKIRRYQKVIELDPQDILGYYSLGEAYLENERYREAAEVFAKGLKVDPQHSSSYYGLGQAYQALGENASAREVFLKGRTVAESRGDVMVQKKIEARLRQLGVSKT